MSDVQGSNPGTATGYALLMSSSKSETRVQCFPLWCGLTRIITPEQEDDLSNESDVKLQMRPTCLGGIVVTSSPHMSDVQGSNPGTATGYALLMSSSKSETRVQCFPLWCGLTRIITPEQEDDLSNESGVNIIGLLKSQVSLHCGANAAGKYRNQTRVIRKTVPLSVQRRSKGRKQSLDLRSGYLLFRVVPIQFQREHNWIPKRTSQDILVINLAVGDALFSVINGFLLKTLSGFATHWVWVPFACSFYGFTGGLFGFVSLASMTFIAIERYYGALRTTPYLITKKRALWIIPCIWIWSATWPSLPYFGIGRWVLEGFQTSCTFDYISRDTPNRVFTICLFVLGFLLPVTATLLAYSAVYWLLHRTSDELRQVNRCEGDSKRLTYTRGYSIRQMRLAKASFAAFTLFVVSWGPYATVALISIMGFQNHLTTFSTEIPGLFAKTSAIYNPFLFATKDRKFRRVVALHFPVLQRYLFQGHSSSYRENPTKIQFASSSQSSISTNKGAGTVGDDFVALNRFGLHFNDVSNNFNSG
ncbi:r-opsin [Clonorchis sinensis]|uniref:R-opsin n=1 Tax=Clonorchis sinensis TaxID=79923 RepID=G7YDJ6_CLOSI|nr:r-opsin [Clonorchis sinensis]